MFLMFDNVDWFNDTLRGFFGGIDELIYSLVGWVLGGIFEMSNLVVNQTLVKVIYDRIYIILSIFMVFKLIFSFIKYLVSPDAMSDKEQGAGKVVLRTIIMLCLLIFLNIFFFEPLITLDERHETDTGEIATTPVGYTILSALQKAGIETLPKLILGIEPSVINMNASAYGEDIALSMLRTMYYPMECEENAEKCDDPIKGSNHLKGLSLFVSTLRNDDEPDGKYDYYYMWPITTIAGILLVVILLGMAIDIAIRTFKLIILEMIAPIPVMTYIDPKASKEGGSFNKWLSMFISTYIDLFIKLGVIYLVILLISQLFKSGGLFTVPNGFAGNYVLPIADGKVRSFVVVFLIIGLFKFAKEAPKFLKDALGIKDSGGGLFDNLKTIGAAAGMAGGALAGAGAGLFGGAAAMGASIKASKRDGLSGGKTFLRAAGAGLGGLGSGFTGFFKGGADGFKGGKGGNPFGGFSNALSAQNARSRKAVERAAAGSTMFGRMHAGFDEAFGMAPSYVRDAEDEANLRAAYSSLKAARDTASDNAFKNANLTDKNGVGFSRKYAYTRSDGSKASIDINSKNGDHSSFKRAFDFANSHGQQHMVYNGEVINMNDAGRMWKEMKNDVTDFYMSTDDAMGDATIRDNINKYNESVSKVSRGNRGSVTEIHNYADATADNTKAVNTRANDVDKSIDRRKVRKYNADKNARGGGNKS